MVHQVAAVVAEPLRPQPDREFVGRPAEVADVKLLPGKPRMEKRLEIPEILHPLGEGVADENHMVVRAEFERGRIRGHRPGQAGQNQRREDELQTDDCQHADRSRCHAGLPRSLSRKS